MFRSPELSLFPLAARETISYASIMPVRRFVFIMLFVFAGAVAIGVAAPASAPHDLQLGKASVDITPRVGTPLAGYYYERPSEGIHDPLFAKAMVLQSDETKIALVQLDLISTSRWFVEDARRAIEQKTGIPASNILISATHAHTGPILALTSTRYDALGGTHPLAVEFAKTLPALIATSVSAANEHTVPVKISAGIGTEENLSFNRRYFMSDGTVGWNPGKLNPNIVKPAGPIDPDVALLYFESLTNAPVAAYVNFAIHLDIVGGRMISADAPTPLGQFLAEAKGTNFFTLFHNGTCGNINHVNTSIRRPQGGSQEAARVAAILAANVLKTIDLRATSFTNSLPLRVSSEIVELPLPKIASGAEQNARIVLEKDAGRGGVGRTGFLEVVDAFKVLDVAQRSGKPQQVEVQVFALGGEIAWVGLPGEIFVELGLAIKRASPFRYTFIAELANGSIGYIPNREAYSQGNYEVVSARCAEGSGEMLVDSALRQLRKLFRSQ